jgi:hypothetical protein
MLGTVSVRLCIYIFYFEYVYDDGILLHLYVFFRSKSFHVIVNCCPPPAPSAAEPQNLRSIPLTHFCELLTDDGFLLVGAPDKEFRSRRLLEQLQEIEKATGGSLLSKMTVSIAPQSIFEGASEPSKEIDKSDLEYTVCLFRKSLS